LVIAFWLYPLRSATGDFGLRSGRQDVPIFSLYGEQGAAARIDGPVHVEDIQSRSRKYLWQIGAHRHAELCQCILFTAGPARIVIEELRTKLDGPALVIIPAGAIHSFRFRADTLGYVLTINFPHLSELAAAAHQAPIDELFSLPRALDLSFNPALADRASQMLECLCKELRRPEPASIPVRGWLACCVLYTLAETLKHSSVSESCSGTDLVRLRRFRQLIENRYAQHWPIERFARELGLSETSLNRLCRRLTGSTGFDLLQQRLALEARRRLIYATDSVSGIASALGFNDSAYFARFFRRHSGVSPHEYRRAHRGG
jgi:AraC family transcriptional regulator, transcriptional activator of pobA